MARAPSARTIQSRPRGVHIHLRDGDIVDGGIYLTDGQALAPYLASRKNGWVNVVNAVWLREGELHNHAVLQTDHVVMASASHRDIPVISETQNGVPRPVDILLEDGTRIRGNLLLGQRQRLSDYLAGCGKFLALLSASGVQDGDALGDVAVNCGCVKAVRDAKVFDAQGPPTSHAVAKQEWGGLRRAPTATGEPQQTANRERITRPTGEIMVVTPAYANDRRVGAAPYVSPVTPAAPSAIPEHVGPLTEADQRRAAAASHHWLVQLAADANLTPLDARDLPDDFTSEDVWEAIALRNEMAVGELAVVVASSYRLDMADLDNVSLDAVKILPEKIAKRLGALALQSDGRVLTVAVSEPESIELEQQLGFVTRLALRFVVATPADIAGAIEWHYKELAAQG